MGRLSSHAKGLLLTGTGVLILSPESLLVRLISMDQWSMVFWRGSLTCLALTVYLTFRYGWGVPRLFWAVGRTGLAVVVVLATGTMFFILALNHTSVANTLVIISAAPLFAAFFSWLFLAEVVPGRTWAAIVAATAGIALLTSDSAAAGFNTIAGDVAAMITAICMAGTLTLLRRGRALNMVPALALSGLLSALVTLPLAIPLAVPPEKIGLLLLLGLVVLPLGFALAALGPRYLPAPEVALIMIMEAVLGPLWVWLAIGETPSERVLVGGAIVVTALLMHSLIGWRQARRDVALAGAAVCESRRKSSPYRRFGP